MDTNKLILKLAKFQQDLEAGRIVLPTAMGPGTLKKNSIKAKSITSTMIDVNSLNSVNANTGDLSITGNLTMAASGAIRAGKTAYSDTVNAGYWLGLDSGAGKFRIGSATQQLLWDGTNLSITGSITASSGTIGGWTIGTTDLTADAGAIGLASSGSIRIWLGSATPSSAPFRVTSAGALTSTSGSIGGWTIDSTGLRLGSGATSRGMDSGSIAFYAGSATPSSAPFRVGTDGAVTMTSSTITGSVTASSLSITGTASFSGGSLTLPGGGTITSSTLDLNSGTIAGMTVDGTLTVNGGKIEFTSGGTAHDVFSFKVAGTQKGTIFADSTRFYFQYGATGSLGSVLQLESSKFTLAAGASGSANAIVFDGSTDNFIIYNNSLDQFYLQGGDAGFNLGDSGGTYAFRVATNGAATRFMVASNGAVGIYANATTGIATGYSTLGSLTGRWAIYNDSGTLVGYIPVYTSIT